MDTVSVSKVTGSSSTTSALEPLNFIHGAREIIEGSTSCACYSMREECIQDNTCSDALNSGVEDDNTNDYCVTDRKVSGECELSEDNGFPSHTTNANTTVDEVNDVKICDICGDVGYEEMLVICSECNEGAEHIYCMQTLLCNIPEGDWFCDDCKLKFNERDQSKVITDSPLSSLSEETEENNASKVLSSTELKLSSDKMEMLKDTDNSEECSNRQLNDSNKASAGKKNTNKRQIDDSNKASENKKQATGIDNVQINASQLLHKGNSSCKVLETTRADGCGIPLQIKIPVSPRFSREGSLKMSGAGKSDSKNSTPRSLSRESSLKIAETRKVKFLPMHTAATLCSGMTVRETSKFTVIDGNSNLAPSKTGLIDPHQTSSRIGSITATDLAVPLVNRSGYQSSLRLGLSKSDGVFPSFLLSSRSNTPRRHSNLRSSKEAIHGDGQLCLAGNTSAKMGNSRSSNSRSCVPTSFNHSKDNNVNVNADVNGMSKCSFGELTVSIVEKSNTDICTLHIHNLGSLKPDELELAKENSHLISPSAEECFAVPTQVLQPQESMSEEYKENTMAKTSSEELLLTNRAVKDLASTECSNVLHSVTQDPAGMKPVEEIINMLECTHEKNGKRLSAPILAQSDGVSTHPAVSPLMDVSHTVKDRSPEADDLLLIKGTEMLKSRKDDCTHPDAASADGKVTVTVGKKVKLLVSNKQAVPSSLDKQTSEEVVPKTSVKMSMDKDMVRKSSSTLDDNKSVVSLRTTQNISSQIILGSNGGEMEMKPASKLSIRENLNSSTPNSTEANVHPTKGSSKSLFSLGRNPENHLSATSIPRRFGREVFESQNDKSIVPPLEINVSSSTSVQSQVNSSSEKYSRGMPLQGMFGFTQQCLPTRPESWFMWRGGFEVINKISEHLICDGMQAHLSNKSSLRVYEESRKFSSQLLLEQVQRYDAWPKRFEESPPTDEDIALYIFPVETESCKIQYFELLEMTIQQDLALRVNLERAELLIFASNQLPERYHRYNGQMYLWGVFRGRKKITLADSQQQFPDCNNVGNDVQPSSKHLLMKNNPLPIQLTSANASGCSEGEEDMDVDMEGGREIGLAERPATKSETQVANAMEDDATNISVTSNSKHVSSHYENLKSGSWMSFEQDAVSLVASWSNSAKFVGTITEMKECNFADIEGKKGLGKTERSNPRPESQLANIMEKSVAQRSTLSNSKPKLSHHNNPKSGGIISFEQSRNSSFTSRHSSAKVLGNIPEYMPSNVHVKDADRRNEQSRSCYANDVLEFPPGFELPPVCHNSSAISRSNCGKHNEAMPENVNSFGIHANLEGGKLPPGFEVFSDNTKSSVNYLASGFSSQHCSHLSAAVLSEEFPPGCDPVSLKASTSSPDHPPGLEPAFVKPLVSFLDRSCDLETTHTKSLFPSPVCQPSFKPTYIEPWGFSEEYPPGLEPTLVKPLVIFPGRPPCHEHTSTKPLVSSPDFPPGLEPAFIKPLLFSPVRPPGLEITSMKSVVSSAECPPGLEAVSVKPRVTLQVCPSGLVPSVQNPSFPLHNSYVTEPAEGTPNLSSSECPLGIKAALRNCPLTSLDHPPGFDSGSGKPFTLSSGHPVEHLACKKLQDKPDLEVENTVESIRQRSAKLLTGKDDSSRDRTKIYHADGRKGVTHTDSVSPVTREANKDANLANIYKNRSFREESYYGRSRRERNDGRRDKSRSRENEYDWKRSGNSHRDVRTREWHMNYNREKEDRKERYRNYRREKESRKEHSRRNRGEEQGTRHGERKITERESPRNRDTGYHRHRSSYAGTRRHKGYDKHSHSLYDCSHPESTMRSYSAMGGKCIVDATGKTTSSYHSKSSFSDFNIENQNCKSLSLETVYANKEDAATVNLDRKEATTDIDSVSDCCPLKSEEKLQDVEVCKNLTDEHHNQKSLSLERVSANREDTYTVNLDRREAIEDIDSVQLPRSGYCPLEAEEKFQIEASRNLTDEHHNKKSSSLVTVSVNKEDAATYNLDRRDTITDIDSVQLQRSEYCPLEAEEKFQNIEASRNLSDEHQNHQSLSSENVSANRNDTATVNLDNREAITEIGSVQFPRSEHCLLEPEEKFQNIEASRKLTDHHFLICDLNDDAVCEDEVSDQENISGEAVQEPTQANISDFMFSRTEFAISHSGKVKQHVIPIQRNWSSGSRATMHDSVQCLPLFPVEENCGKAEISVSDWNSNLELGLGQRTTTIEPLPLLEQSSLQNLSCNFMFEENFSNSRSRSVFDSREPNSADKSILSLAMPQYRRQGNSWIEVTEDTELSEEVDADLKLTL